MLRKEKTKDFFVECGPEFDGVAKAIKLSFLNNTLNAVDFVKKLPKACDVIRLESRTNVGYPQVNELREFLAGRRKELSINELAPGTDFQRAVWMAATKIPFGETRSYAEIAQAIGKPRAARAVGAALGRNPMMLFVPCHRVIGSGGSLTGFAGGLQAKRALLDFEMRRVLPDVA